MVKCCCVVTSAGDDDDGDVDDATKTQCMAFKYKKIYNSLWCVAFVWHRASWTFQCVSVSALRVSDCDDLWAMYIFTADSASRWDWVSVFVLIFFFSRFFASSSISLDCCWCAWKARIVCYASSTKQIFSIKPQSPFTIKYNTVSSSFLYFAFFVFVNTTHKSFAFSRLRFFFSFVLRLEILIPSASKYGGIKTEKEEKKKEKL